MAGRGRTGRVGKLWECGGWGTGPALWAERAFQGPWVRGRAWEGGSVQAIEFGEAPLLGKKGRMAGQGSRDLDERGSWSRAQPGHPTVSPPTRTSITRPCFPPVCWGARVE